MGEKSQFWRRWLSNLLMLPYQYVWKRSTLTEYTQSFTTLQMPLRLLMYSLQFLRWEISRSSRETDDYTQIGIVSRSFSCQNESDVTRGISDKSWQWFGQTPQLSSNKSRAKRQTILHVCDQLPGSDTWWLRTFPVELRANNPADDAGRKQMVKELLKREVWFRGPKVYTTSSQKSSSNRPCYSHGG